MYISSRAGPQAPKVPKWAYNKMKQAKGSYTKREMPGICYGLWCLDFKCILMHCYPLMTYATLLSAMWSTKDLIMLSFSLSLLFEYK